MKAAVSFSGGLDSSTLLAVALQNEREVLPVFFNYGSKHAEWELTAAQQVCQHYQLDLSYVDFASIMTHFTSNLLKSGGDIPEGHYQEESMRSTVVPARNIIFASFLAGFAWSFDCEEVWLGIHSGDHFIYPDCRPDFFYHMNKAIELGTEGKVKLHAPFINQSKADIVNWGLRLHVPYEMTRTCYTDNATACGRCGSCTERREAFKLCSVKDPIKYEYTGPLPKKPE